MEFNLNNFDLITQQQQLDKVIAAYQKATVLFLDTEFVRTKTFYAQLGLIQVYDGTTGVLIDPTYDLDLSAFWTLLTNPSIIKVLHSAHEDLEIFLHYGQCQPTPLFDTQVAASLNGFGSAVGYANLVHQLLGVSLDKTESRTNWLARPLTPEQLDYAAKDVLYLEKIYHILSERLDYQQRLDWVFEEGRYACSIRIEPVKPELAYLDIKNAYQLSERQLAVLRALASWRLQQARAKNLAVGFIVKENGLMALAKKMPDTLEDLLQIKSLLPKEKQKYGLSLLQCIQEGLAVDDLPEKIDVLYFNTRYKSDFQQVKDILKSIADEYVIPIEMIGSKKLIHQYLKWVWNDHQAPEPLLNVGWRAQLCAEKLQQITMK